MNRIIRKNFKLALIEKGKHYNQPTIYFPMMEKKMSFIVVAIVCKDTKKHKLLENQTLTKREKDKRMIAQIVSISLGPGHEEPGNNTHLILLPRNYS